MNLIVITRQNYEAVVMLSLGDFKSYEETAYLMQSIINSDIVSLESGKGKNREL